MIPFIPPSLPFVQGPVPPPPEPDFDGYPKRSVCAHCDDVIEQAADGAPWTVGSRFGDSRECFKAPNADDGPMPDHAPGIVLHPPKKASR